MRSMNNESEKMFVLLQSRDDYQATADDVKERPRKVFVKKKVLLDQAYICTYIYI